MIIVSFAGPVATDLAGGGAVAALRLTDGCRQRRRQTEGWTRRCRRRWRRKRRKATWRLERRGDGAIITPDTTEVEGNITSLKVIVIPRPARGSTTSRLTLAKDLNSRMARGNFVLHHPPPKSKGSRHSVGRRHERGE